MEKIRPQNRNEVMQLPLGSLVEERDYGAVIYLGRISPTQLTFVAMDARKNLGQIVIDSSGITLERGILKFQGSWNVKPFVLSEANKTIENKYRELLQAA